MNADQHAAGWYEKFKALFTTEHAAEVETLKGQLVEAQQALNAANATLSQNAESLTARDAELSTVRGQLSAAQTQVTTLTAQVATLTTERDALKATVADPKGAIQTAAAGMVAATLANNSIPAAKLDGTDDGAESYESVQAALARETDPKRKAELAQKCRVLRGHPDLFGTGAK